ncbi:bifunctional solanapyrone synthase [Podospora australis]|uniref:Bifunctional solanapyrone synthase n=1 Tax=Podospora australis TaxID=1536484 RepID=A0AAN6WKP1_9PEZI|nr:bifunctional solanapyrone synthase [Podospora australis]
MTAANSTRILDALTSVLGSGPASLSVPGTEEYDESNGSYFSAFENEIKPAFIAKPATVQQVQGLVKVLRAHVLEGSVQIAIRGTGHTPFAGSANIQDGVTIDLRRLKGITLNEDKSTVEIAVGETWTTVYAELEEHGLTTAGGRVGRVGVGGFILGGGLSMVSSRRGFACDSVTEFKVVLASGELVRANAGEKSDLWTALKGGLNNFGIVTSITMTTFAAGDMWGGLTYYPPETFEDLLSNACNFAQKEPDEDVHIMCSAGYGFGHQAVTCCMWHTQGKVNPPSLQWFTGVQPQIEQMNTMRTSTHSDFCDELSKFTVDGARNHWTSLTVRADIDLIKIFRSMWQETLQSIKDAEGFVFSLGFHPLTRALLENSRKAGGNAMDISPSDGPLFVVLINPSWALPEDDGRIFAAVESLATRLRELASKRGLLHRYIFTNYAHRTDHVMAGYGKESLDRLRDVSAKYDPEGMFQKGVPGGFKLVRE